jgi:hypothetical protein
MAQRFLVVDKTVLREQSVFVTISRHFGTNLALDVDECVMAAPD